MDKKQLEALRGEGKLTNARIAELTGLSPSTLSRIFSGQTEPRFEDVAAIARVTGCSLDELAGLGTSEAACLRAQLKDKDEVIRVQRESLERLDKAERREHKEKVILAVVLAVILLVFLGIVVYDVLNGDIGWARYQEAMKEGGTTLVGRLINWIRT